MKTLEVKLYSYNELNEQAKSQALADWQESRASDPCLLEWTSDEILDTLKALADCLGLSLRDWSFGAYCQDWKAKVAGLRDDWQGNKALAYAMRCLMDKGYERKPTFQGFKDHAFCGQCGLTGICFDDDMGEELFDNLLGGDSIAQAFDKLAYKAGQILESEQDYLTSEACFHETIDKGEEIYTENGKVY